jgi:hypothetical protein
MNRKLFLMAFVGTLLATLVVTRFVYGFSNPCSFLNQDTPDCGECVPYNPVTQAGPGYRTCTQRSNCFLEVFTLGNPYCHCDITTTTKPCYIYNA